MNKRRSRAHWLPLVAAVSYLFTYSDLPLAANGIQMDVPAAKAPVQIVQKHYRYKVTLHKPLQPGRRVVASGVNWDCTSGHTCIASGPWPVPRVSDCSALARQVGEIRHYGHAEKSLSTRQLQQCNQGRNIAPPPRGSPPGSASPAVPNPVGKSVPGRYRPMPAPGQPSLPPSSPQKNLSRHLQTGPVDLGIERVARVPGTSDTPVRNGDRVPVRVVIRNNGGLAGQVVVTTTGDSRMRQILNKSAPLTVAPGAVTEVPLEMYINPQHVRNGMFRAYVWLGTVSEPLVYRDTNRDNNSFEVAFEVQQERRPAHSPVVTIGSRSGGSSSDCDDSLIDTSCRVQPDGCSGRGPDWTVSGTYQCLRGELSCVARAGTDYCNHCGGNCGGCVNESCSVINQCAPGSLCIDNTAIYPRPTCRSLNDDYVARLTGRRVCTNTPGFCWTPDETGMAEIICLESRQ